MFMKRLYSIVLFLFVSLLMAPSALSNDIFSSKFDFLKGEPELLPVEQAFVFNFKQENEIVTLSFAIEPNYYLYRDKLTFEVDGATLGEIALAQGKLHYDDYFGEQQVFYNQIDIPIALKKANEGSQLTVTFMGCAEGVLCYPPTKQVVLLSAVETNPGELPQQLHQQTEKTNSEKNSTTPITQQDSLSEMLAGDSIFWTLMIFFGLGIGLALTPCVFPMYPILSGIIVGQGEKLSLPKAFSLSMIYVQGMAITYALLGLIVASAGMKYQAALQHPAVLIIIAILFFILSLSMFGCYELRLPSRWQQKMNTLSNRQQGGKVTGVFLMGVLSGLVASPCTTAPLSGALMYVAQSGDLMLGFFALYILSLGMGVPLLVIGTSGGKLLPKAGSWMDVIKAIFGFLLIAVSIVMLTRIWVGFVADMLWSIWGIVFIGYLMHQNSKTQFNWKQTVRSVLLILLLLASASFGFQAVMGELNRSAPQLNSTNIEQIIHPIKIKSLADLNQQLQLAKEQGKPVMLDLYADWCVACKEFENITFVASDVQSRLKQMVFLQADVTKNDAIDIELLEHYQVLGLPTLLMFDASGELRDEYRVTGFMAPEPFAAHLDNLFNFK